MAAAKKNRIRKQTSLSLSPEILSVLDDILHELPSESNRSRLVERMLWYAVGHGVFDFMEVYTHDNG